MDFVLVRENDFEKVVSNIDNVNSYELKFPNKRLENSIRVNDAKIVYPMFIRVIVASKYNKKLLKLFDEFIAADESGNPDDSNRVLSHINEFERELAMLNNSAFDSLYITELKMKLAVLRSQFKVKSNFAEFKTTFRGKI